MTITNRLRRAPSIFCVALFAVALFSCPVSSVLAQETGLIEDEISDPLEGWNRGVFWFNDKFDRYLFEPVAKGYDWVMPDPVQDGVVNVFDNLTYPVKFVSSVMTGDISNAGEHTGRFLINSTLGLLGIFDVATEFGLEKPNNPDIGTALANWGIPHGPYLMLPILGPSSLRNGVGRVGGMFLNPVPWIAHETADDSDARAITLGVSAIDAIQTRADLIDAIEAAREASVDYYLFTQSAFYQYRRARVEGRVADPVTGEESDPFAEDELLDQQLAE